MRPLPLQANRSPMSSLPAPDSSNADEPQVRPRCIGVVTTVVTAALALALAGCAGAPGSSSGTGPTGTSASAPVAIPDVVDHSAGLAVPASVHLATGADIAQARAVVHAAQLIYTFWNTGDTSYLDHALSPAFQDNTLPTGRPQGPAGPAAASAAFRVAVPDLTCQLADLYVTGDTFTARLVFQGHFTGTDRGIKGRGQPVNFNAIDIQHVGAEGRIIEDWHLEDNLTFLQQAGLVTIAGS
jgi:predicted ester cyclase